MSRLYRYLTLCAFIAAAGPAASAQNDPMRPPATEERSAVTKQPSVQRYHLSSILISPQRRSAIINGRRVSVGDRVGSARVVEIHSNQVVLSVAGSYRTLTLLPVSIKTPVEATPQ